MRKAGFDPRRAINGNYGEVMLDGELVREATALQAKAQINFKDVPMCGTSGKKQKSAGWSGTGSITMTKTKSRMALKIADEIKAGRTPEFTIIGKLADPDALGAERVVLKGVTFTELTLADWAAETIGTVTQPFTFYDYEFIDLIDEE